MSLTELQMIRLAALLVSGISASYKFQFQALYYLLVVLYAVTDLPTFLFASFLHIAIMWFSGFYRGAVK